MIIYENKNIVAIATFKTANRKTGDMVQIWVLYKHLSPVEASKASLDHHICGDCPHRHSLDGGCYVNLGQAPQSIWKAYKRGNYPEFNIEAFKGKMVRFGAYGDPAFLPLEIVEPIVKICKGHTGYTHQWKDCDPRFAKYFMASVDSPEEYKKAKKYGWRTFRIAQNIEGTKGEIQCLSDSHGIECKDCTLCNGNKAGKDIYIEAHGSRKNRIA